MKKDKEPVELNKELLKWLDEEDPFGLNEDIKTILFTCLECGEEDDIPEYVVHEFQVVLKRNEEVETVCPVCGGTMRRAGKSPK
ncbi:hypothetical protein ELQ35_01980 [Peribacillus cavernae]|uniref:Uncharacterized protein n=1 Tax=Peribacillus cavernae TaxID=1674310 RepID=A0A3S0U7G7_9BACI|nr:hypothetical protein [Peribacillus cavernae]MDQ0220711.1 putative RNA-binding Zn-ribbon protein involved in translation (DUF1610 family) [Peribacillus cavernae]RUQ32428.1 hypothetical protein ELQ35_01980 [Peribacillus cavernae]